LKMRDGARREERGKRTRQDAEMCARQIHYGRVM
jgi:hypothetical protein